jgi:inosose dehydratase
MKIQVGTNPASWGVWFADDPEQPPWQQYLDEVAKAGYEWIELGTYGYLPTDPKILHRELASRELRVSATHIFVDLGGSSAWPQIENQVTQVSQLLAAVDARFLLLIPASYCDPKTGELLRPRSLNQDAWRRLVDMTHKVADSVQASFSLRVAFHPHIETPVEYEDQIEAFLNQTDPARVGLCLDTGHYAYRGGDPVRFLRRHHDRIPYLHLKNVEPDLIAKVANEDVRFGKAVSMGVFCEPSIGLIDFLALRDALNEIDFKGWGIVEQGMYPTPPDSPLPIAKRTRAYLREIGLG